MNYNNLLRGGKNLERIFWKGNNGDKILTGKLISRPYFVADALSLDELVLDNEVPIGTST